MKKRDELDKMVQWKKEEILHKDMARNQDLREAQITQSVYEQEMAQQKRKMAQLADHLLQENNKMIAEKAQKMAVERNQRENLDEMLLRENSKFMDRERFKSSEARKTQKEMMEKMLEDAERKKRAIEDARSRDLWEANRQIQINNDAYAREQARRREQFNQRVQRINEKQKRYEDKAMPSEYDKERKWMERTEREAEVLKEMHRREEEVRMQNKLSVSFLLFYFSIFL
jgi:hypothetical protein